MMRSRNHWLTKPHAASWLLCSALVALSGCAQILPEMEPFGAVRGVDAKRSVNGLAVHREMWESTGARCLFPKKLSPRLETFDTIVLVGQTFSPPGKRARRWLENWLKAGENRTVIYFGRDFNADLYYRQRTLESFSGEDRLRAEQDFAAARTWELSRRMNEVSEGTFCRWFYYDPSQQRVEYSSQDIVGPWAPALKDLEGFWPVGITLQEPGSQWKKSTPSWLAAAAQNANPMQPANAPGNSVAEDGETVFSQWDQQELATQEMWDEEFKNLFDSETLLETRDGRPLVYRLRPAEANTSQILVVANGAPFLNASLVDPLHRSVGSMLIEECTPSERVALLAYDDYGLTISTIAEEETRAAGLEFLTTWPLNAVMIPAALLGIILCAALIPILGRAQTLPATRVSDFGLHIEALGKMLLESRDERFARQAIQEYFERVRGEQPPRWLQSLATEPLRPADPRSGEQVVASGHGSEVVAKATSEAKLQQSAPAEAQEVDSSTSSNDAMPTDGSDESKEQGAS